MAKKQNVDSIERFAGLAGVRKKPTPYIGPTNGDGLWTVIREPLDNCVDMALKGLNSHVHLVYDSEPGRYWVVDQGEGIPVGVKAFENERGVKEKLNTLYVVTGLTHAGSNFSSGDISRGTHGIGIKATNAMSKKFTVWTFREGDWWCIEYKDIKVVKDVYKAKAPKLPHGLKVKKGTVVMFEPDMTLFRAGTKINTKDVQDWCELTAYLVPGLTVQVTTPKGKTHTLLHKRGPIEYIEKRVTELKCTAQKKMFQYDSKIADVVIAFTDAEGDQIAAYTNGLRNKEGGEHVKANIDAMYNTLKPFMKKIKVGTGKDAKQAWPFTKEDLADGLVGLINYKISAPQFDSQPKNKLIDERVYPIAYPQLEKVWTNFWDKNKSLCKDVVKRASELRSKTADFLKDKKLIKNVNAARKNLSVKLAGIIGNPPVERCELFLVEGESAGGGAKRARDKTYQAIYPLKGKPLNVMEAKKEKVNSNDEVAGLLAALGMDLNAKDPTKTVKYGKVIMLADPDVDGCHINCLLLGILVKYTPHLVKGGHVYAVRAPLYKGKKGDKVYFGMTKDEVYQQSGSNKTEITYLKGWGECDEEDLAICLDPGKRQLYRVTWSDAEKMKEFSTMLGADSSYRKDLLGVV